MFKAFILLAAAALILAGAFMLVIVAVGFMTIGWPKTRRWRPVLAFSAGASMTWLGLALAMYLQTLGRQ